MPPPNPFEPPTTGPRRRPGTTAARVYDDCMATWEDGPEYAPIERPTDFADAGAAPLSMAPPVIQMAAQAPKDRPFFDQPPAPVAPLETLVAAPPETRDPQVPFAVASSTMTSDSAWGALHSGPPSRSAGPGPARRPPHRRPIPGPGRSQPNGTAPLVPTSAPPPDGRFPAPGHAGLVRPRSVR